MAPSMPAVTMSTAMTVSPAVPQVVPVGATPPRPVRIQVGCYCSLSCLSFGVSLLLIVYHAIGGGRHDLKAAF